MRLSRIKNEYLIGHFSGAGNLSTVFQESDDSLLAGVNCPVIFSDSTICREGKSEKYLKSIQNGDDRKNLNLLREGPKYMPAAAFETSLFLRSEAVVATENDMELSKGDSDAASSFLIWFIHILGLIGYNNDPVKIPPAGLGRVECTQTLPLPRRV